MPMSASQMATEIISAVKGTNPELGAGEEANITPELQAMCEAIIAHLIANAVVKVTVVGGSSAGQHTGSITE